MFGIFQIIDYCFNAGKFIIRRIRDKLQLRPQKCQEKLKIKVYLRYSH